MKVNANAASRSPGLKPPLPPPPRRSFERVLAAAHAAKTHLGTHPRESQSPEGGLPAAPQTLDEVRQSRALGFRELGMFGGAGAKDLPASPNSEIDDSGLTPPLFAAEPARALPVNGPRPAIEPRAEAPVDAQEGFLAPAQAIKVPEKATDLAVTLGEMLNLSAPLEDRVDADSDSAPMAARRSARPGPATDKDARPSLVVAEGEGALQIVAAASLTPEARQRLRKAADDLAVELGLTLKDFTLNGGPLERASFTPIGALHGARPR